MGMTSEEFLVEFERAVADHEATLDQGRDVDTRARIEPDSPCVCGHVFDEHQPSCVAIVEVHERQVYCSCTVFDLDEAIA